MHFKRIYCTPFYNCFFFFASVFELFHKLISCSLFACKRHRSKVKDAIVELDATLIELDHFLWRKLIHHLCGQE